MIKWLGAHKWQKVEAGHGAMLLSDQPGSQPQISDLFEQGSIAEEIGDTIAQCLMQSQEHEGRSYIIALHGQKGQGKSTVIKAIEKRFHQTLQNSGKRMRPVYVRQFNCADYEADDLLNNYDYFLHWGRLCRGVFLSVLVTATLLGLVWYFAPDSNSMLNLKALSLLGIIAPSIAVPFAIYAPFRVLFRDMWRDIRIGRGTRKSVLKLIKRLGMQHDISIIDNLERASLSKQQALLQSLRRHRKDMRGVTLVVFDDSDLLETEGPRQEATELMDKVFDVSFRLSPMNAWDAGQMAWAFCDAIAKHNPECKTAQKFRHPALCGTLARIYLLHGNASARFAKKLVNNVYLASRHGRYEHVSDILSVLRLHGVFLYIPVIETELDFISKNLIEMTPEIIIDTVESRTGKTLPESHKRQLERYLHATHHIQPANHQWDRVLRMWRREPTSSNKEDAKNWHDTFTRDWAINEAYLSAQTDPVLRLQLYQKMRDRPLKNLGQREQIPSAWYSGDLASTERDRDVPDSSVETDAAKKYWRALVDNLLVFDREVFTLLSKPEQEELVLRHKATPISAPFLPNDPSLTHPDLRYHVRHVLRHAADVREAVALELRAWNDVPRKEYQAALPDLPGNGAVLEAAMEAMQREWPPFAPDARTAVLDRHAAHHFRQLGLLLLDAPRDKETILPEAHIQWLRRMAKMNGADAIHRAIRILHMPGSRPAGLGGEEGNPSFEKADPIWHLGAQKDIWCALKSVGYAAPVQERLCKTLQGRDAIFTDLWALVIDDPSQVNALTARLARPAKFLPAAPAINGYAPDWFYDVERVSWPDFVTVRDQWVRKYSPKL